MSRKIIRRCIIAATALAFAGVYIHMRLARIRTRLDSEICRGRLSQLALALENYQIRNGSYPPAYSTDATGRRLHSWRVLILPDLGLEDVYSKFDLTTPWDSPENLSAAATPQALSVFRCPAMGCNDAKYTSYFAIVDDVGQWAADATDADGRERMLVVELARCDVLWTEPRDVSAHELRTLVRRHASDMLVHADEDGMRCINRAYKVTVLARQANESK